MLVFEFHGVNLCDVSSIGAIDSSVSIGEGEAHLFGSGFYSIERFRMLGIFS
uniref:Uncharacterized protein n=1 Tax=Manihot esculenta TaxID=3983 RepID=A0A2C9VH17_MANES